MLANGQNDRELILTNRKLTIVRRVTFFDEKNRPLSILARIIFKIGSSLNGSTSTDTSSSIVTSAFESCPIAIHILAVYCFFNLTGLPLIFRQYTCGQFEEHEQARSNQPLLFSYNGVESSPFVCTMRIRPPL